MLRLTKIVAVVAILSTCAFAPEGAEKVTPPDVYRDWWAKTEDCSGIRGRFERVDWYQVPGNSFKCGNGYCAGHWEEPHSIYMAAEWANVEWAVRHEMLHDLIGHSGHPLHLFKDRCDLLAPWASYNVEPSG